MFVSRSMFCAGLAFLLSGACGDQASTNYEGEALLSIRGEALLTEDSIKGPVVPAIAFATGRGEELAVIDVAVEGEFPAGFTLHVFEPPPDEALVGPPWGALGYIVAADADHPPSFPSSNPVSVSNSSGCTLEPAPLQACSEPTAPPGATPQGCPDCPLPPEPVPTAPPCGHQFEEAPPCHRVRREFCEVIEEQIDHDECYVEVRECEFVVEIGEGENYDECEVIEGHGDPELARGFLSNFHGVAENLAVLYLAEPAGPDSWPLQLFDLRPEIPAGYHLITVRDLTDEELAEQQACYAAVQSEAWARYLEEHPDSTCELIREENQPRPLAHCPDDDGYFTEASEAEDALWHHADVLQEELGCPWWNLARAEVVDASGEISIAIGNRPPPLRRPSAAGTSD